VKTLRQLHLYLGCVFAPLIIYFALSGSWQVLGLNQVPKDDQPPTALHSFFHELSKPHKSATLPGLTPKADRSAAFAAVATLMGLGLIVTTLLGLVLALRSGRSATVALGCIGAGILLPIFLLWIH
jgi:hypothetical protein